jgi:DNA repair exonuclease SbcCD ATPase subunit
VKDAAMESLKTELASAKKSSAESAAELLAVQKATRAKESELTAAVAASKRASMAREVELSSALASAKAAAQKAMAAAAAARAERTSDIIDVLSAKETQVEGLMTSLDAIKVEREMMAAEGIPPEDAEEVAEKDELIKALVQDLAKENGWKGPTAAAVAEYSVAEVAELRRALEKRENALGLMVRPMRGVQSGPKAKTSEIGEYTMEELVALREKIEERERELADDPKHASAMAGSVGGSAIDFTCLRQEGKSAGAKRELDIVEKEIVRLRSENATRSTTITSLQRELDELLETGLGPMGSATKLVNVDRDEVTKKLLLKREEALTHELSSVRAMYEMSKQQHSAALTQRELILDGLKTDLMAVRKQLSTAEKDAANLRKEMASRETEVAAEASSAKAAADAAKVAHAAQVSAKEAAIEALRADLAAARRAIASAEADIVSLKKAAAARDAQLTAELNAQKLSYEVLKLAAAAGKPVGAADGKGGSGAPAMSGATGSKGSSDTLFRPDEVTSQLAAREAQVESLRAELLAVRRAVAAAEEEAQSRREAAAALESELTTELAAAKAAHEAAELAAAELATNAASNAQNAANMMSLLSEQLSSEREARRTLEAELRAAMEAHPDLPRITFPLPPLAQPGKKSGGGLGLLKGIVAGVAAGLATRAVMPPAGPAKPQPRNLQRKAAPAGAAAAPAPGAK